MVRFGLVPSQFVLVLEGRDPKSLAMDLLLRCRRYLLARHVVDERSVLTPVREGISDNLTWSEMDLLVCGDVQDVPQYLRSRLDAAEEN